MLESKLIYFAKTEAGEKISVKFTRTYSEVAQNFVVDIACGHIMVDGLCIMVLMDRIDLNVYLPYYFQLISKSGCVEASQG